MSDVDVNGEHTGRDGLDAGEAPLLEFGAAPDLPVTVEIRVSNGPIASIDITADGSRLMVTNYGDSSVSVIDTDTCRVLETVAGIDEPFAIAMSGAEANRAYVSTVSPAYDSIGVIEVSTNSIVATHPLTLSVSDLTVSPDGKYVYASRNGARGADVAVLDTTTGRVASIDIATTPGTTAECVRISPDGGHLYVGTNGPCGGQLVVVATRSEPDEKPSRAGRPRWRRKNGKEAPAATDAKPKLRIVGTIEIGSAVRDVSLSPDGATAYVASCGADFGAVIDVIDTRTSTITGTRKIDQIGGLVTRLSLGGNGARAYLVSEDRVTVLNTLNQEIIGTVRAGQPSCVVESRDGSLLYIADNRGTISVTPVAAALSGIDVELQARDASAEWIMPELLQYEAALA